MNSWQQTRKKLDLEMIPIGWKGTKPQEKLTLWMKENGSREEGGSLLIPVVRASLAMEFLALAAVGTERKEEVTGGCLMRL